VNVGVGMVATIATAVGVTEVVEPVVTAGVGIVHD
jgi:hypothetical protein